MPKRKVSGSSAAKRGVMAILSPAKTLDLSPIDEEGISLEWTYPDVDADKTKTIAKILKSKEQSQLAKLLNISTKLAATAHRYWSDFQYHVDGQNDTNESSMKASIFSFSGAAYQGLDIATCSQDDLLYLQDSLRIIDPLYGVLRPLDLMQPYRLEMATKKVFPEDKTVKLAEYWREAVTARLAQDLSDNDRTVTQRILLNLASDEYSAAVDANALPSDASYVKVVFRQEGRIIAVHAKRARGLMVRYLAQNNVDDFDGVKDFNLEGYTFQEDESDETTLVFDREKPETNTTGKNKTETTSKKGSNGRKRAKSKN